MSEKGSGGIGLGNAPESATSVSLTEGETGREGRNEIDPKRARDRAKCAREIGNADFNR